MKHNYLVNSIFLLVQIHVFVFFQLTPIFFLKLPSIYSHDLFEEDIDGHLIRTTNSEVSRPIVHFTFLSVPHANLVLLKLIGLEQAMV